ncbi:MAG: hypothetical protein FWC27_05370 [Firmicutes bacterium]|nr:hypothetical protein [Bacillota bacterium]
MKRERGLNILRVIVVVALAAVVALMYTQSRHKIFWEVNCHPFLFSTRLLRFSADYSIMCSGYSFLT